jgi:glycerol-3-phosphate dehydrogenase
MQNMGKSQSGYFDVAIIGGGVVGSLIAFRLSEYRLRVCLIEKEADLACGASGANSSIVHAGYDPLPGTKKAIFNSRGSQIMQKWCKNLGVPYRRNGAILLAFSLDEELTLRKLLQQGRENQVAGLEILSKEGVLKKEPAISPSITAGLYVPNSATVCPYELTFAGAEIAALNGTTFYFEHRVTAIRKREPPDSESGFHITCNLPYSNDPIDIYSRTVVNAAGVYSDVISAMAGDASFTILARRGEYVVLDKSLKGFIGHTIFQTPNKKGKGVLVTPTVDGNILVGPNSNIVDDPGNTATSRNGLDEVIRMGLKSLPNLDVSQAIRNFAGIRATPSTGDFIVGASEKVKGLFQAAGIESPGLTAAPAIAEELERQVAMYFTPAIERKSDYIKHREPPIRFRDLSGPEQEDLIKKDKKYSSILCRCENITEAEILEAIRRPLGASTINGIKMRTRAGMGRCQGGFCMPRILPILARERSIPMESVTISGMGSEMIKGNKR